MTGLESCDSCGFCYDPATALEAKHDPEFIDRLNLPEPWVEHVDVAMKDLMEVMTEAEAALTVNGALRGLLDDPPWSHKTFKEFHERTTTSYNTFKLRGPPKCEKCGKAKAGVTEVQQPLGMDPGAESWTPDDRFHLICPDCRMGQRIMVGVDFGEGDVSTMVVMAYDPISRVATVLDVSPVEKLRAARGREGISAEDEEPPINKWIATLAASRRR